MKMDSFFTNSFQTEKCRCFRKASGSSVPQIKFCKLMQHQHNEEEAVVEVVVVWRALGSASTTPVICCQAQDLHKGSASAQGIFQTGI